MGAGLLGTSIGLALSEQGIAVLLRDRNAEHLRTASGLGAGMIDRGDGSPALVVVAVSPGYIGRPVDEVAARASQMRS